MKRNKYGARRTEYNGRWYDSKFEAAVAKELREGDYGMWGLDEQVVFRFDCGATYRADFVAYFDDGWRFVVIEAKGRETDVWKLKRKLFRHEYPRHTLLVVKKLSDLEALRGEA